MPMNWSPSAMLYFDVSTQTDIRQIRVIRIASEGDIEKLCSRDMRIARNATVIAVAFHCTLADSVITLTVHNYVIVIVPAHVSP